MSIFETVFSESARSPEPFFTFDLGFERSAFVAQTVQKLPQVEIGFVVYHASHGTAMILSGSVFPISAARAAPLAMESVSSSSALRSVVFRKGTSP